MERSSDGVVFCLLLLECGILVDDVYDNVGIGINDYVFFIDDCISVFWVVWNG